MAHEGLNTVASVASLLNSIDSGEPADIASAGVSAYNVITGVQLEIPGTGFPVVAAINIAGQLLEGDVEGAIFSGITTALATFGGPAGIAASVVLSLIGGSLFGPPDPEASLTFTNAPDGGFDFTTDSNETGEGLEARLQSQGGALTQYLSALDDYYVDALPDGIDASALGVIEVTADLDDQENVSYSLDGGRGFENTSLGLGKNPSIEDITRVLHAQVLFTHLTEEWASGERIEIDPETGEAIVVERYYSPFGSLVQPVDTQAVPTGPFISVAQDTTLQVIESTGVSAYGTPPVVPTVQQGLQRYTPRRVLTPICSRANKAVCWPWG